MAIVGKWIGLNVAAFPTTTYTPVPASVFNTQVRNDTNAFNKVDSTITLDTINDADGYIIRASTEIACTHNNRFTAQIRVIPTVNAGNAEVLASVAGQYSRNTTDNDSSSDSFTVITNITGSITFEVQWQRQGSGAPAGSVTNSCLEIIPIYFNGIGLYEGVTNQLLGGVTPEIVTLDSTITESGNIARSGNDIILSANKKYLVMGMYYRQGTTSRTQRWIGFGVNGVLNRDAMTNIYYRDASNQNQGEAFNTIIDAGGADLTLNILGYRGDGITPPSLGGAGVTGNAPNLTLLSVAIIELKGGCETFKSADNTGDQNIGVIGDVELNAARNNIFNDSDSFTKLNDTSYEAQAKMDAFYGANISASYQTASGTRITRRVLASVNGLADVNVNAVKFGRGSQGTQSTFGFSGNPFGLVSLNENDLISTSVQDIGNTVDVRTRAGWAGMWGINLDTMNNEPPPIVTRRFFSIT